MKGGGGGGVKLTPLEKNTFKKPRHIRVKRKGLSVVKNCLRPDSASLNKCQANWSEWVTI